MNDKAAGGVHWSFWAIAIIALIWNVMGVLNFLWQMNTDSLAAMPETHRTIVESRPWWATGGFAVAVFGGALGCLVLLLRKSAATYLFIASLFGVMATLPHILSVGIDFEFDQILWVLMPVVVAAFLIGYAKMAEKRRWIS